MASGSAHSPPLVAANESFIYRWITKVGSERGARNSLRRIIRPLCLKAPLVLTRLQMFEPPDADGRLTLPAPAAILASSCSLFPLAQLVNAVHMTPTHTHQ